MKQYQAIHGYVYLFFLSLILCVLFISCASQATLAGGEKDVKPPKIIKSTPENYIKNFKGKDVKIRFDEYFQLELPSENIIITPTFNKLPDYTIQEKTLVIHFNEELQPNKTYTITLADVVKDITEGNVLPTEQFVFSTGQTMDSCMIAGTIKDAFTKLPQNKIAIMLYETDNDSAPITQKPVYYTYTNVNGNFEFHNLPQRSFLLFALKDNNFNKQFDLPEEGIAFSDTLITSYPIPKALKDTVEIINKARIDSNRIQLLFFVEKDTNLKYLRRFQLRYGFYQFIFSSEVNEFQLLPINPDIKVSYLTEINKNRDTVGLFFMDLVDKEIDFVVYANGISFDTVTINPAAKKQLSTMRRSVNDTSIVKKNTLKFNTINAGELNRKFTLLFDYPIKEVNVSKCMFLELRKEKKQIIRKNTQGNDSLVEENMYDTLVPSCYFTDSTHRNWVIDYAWKYNKNYVLFCADSAFIAYNDTYNDTINIDFKTKTPRDYGEIKITYHLKEQGNYIVHLLSEKGECLDERLINNDTTIIYDYVLPGKYQVRLIKDTNPNNKWDTGNYLEHHQPEKIYYFSKIIDLKSNWTIEEIFSID